MKCVALVAVILVLASGIAVNGSRAQPLAGDSVAFQQCQADTEQCRPLEVNDAYAGYTVYGEARDYDGWWRGIFQRVWHAITDAFIMYGGPTAFRDPGPAFAEMFDAPD